MFSCEDLEIFKNIVQHKYDFYLLWLNFCALSISREVFVLHPALQTVSAKVSKHERQDIWAKNSEHTANPWKAV